MKPLLARLSWRRLAVPAALVAAALVALAPSAWSLPGGASSESIQDPSFAQYGCTACHGPIKKFVAVDNSAVSAVILNADGAFHNGPYVAEASYTIVITLRETVAPDGGGAGNHAGFNLRASAGTLGGVDGQSKATADGKQATHINAQSTAWNVTWKAPLSGGVAFQLYVNDVDGSGAADEGDVVHEVFFGLSDKDGAVPGTAAKVEEPHFGISLQQYWIGLIGLFGMLFIMVAGFVYLKFVSPHNTDQKDR